MGGPGSGRGYRHIYRPPTEGARLLAIHLRRNDITLRTFAVQLGYVPSTFYRQTVRKSGHSLAFAVAVHRWTNSFVDVESWLQPPKRLDRWSPGRQRRPDGEEGFNG